MKRIVGWVLRGIGFFALGVVGLFLPLYLLALVVSSVAGAILNKELFFTLHHVQWWILLGLYALVFAAVLVYCAVKGAGPLTRSMRRVVGGRICAKRGHVWAGYRCSRCGKLKPHEHDWNGCQCTLCGEFRDEGHDWIEHVCPRCNGTGYVLPEYYTSSNYGGPAYDDPDDRELCGCEHPVEYECRVCGKRAYSIES